MLYEFLHHMTIRLTLKIISEPSPLLHKPSFQIKYLFCRGVHQVSWDLSGRFWWPTLHWNGRQKHSDRYVHFMCVMRVRGEKDKKTFFNNHYTCMSVIIENKLVVAGILYLVCVCMWDIDIGQVCSIWFMFVRETNMSTYKL